MARPTSTPGKMPEILTSPILAAWACPRLLDMIEEKARESAEDGTSRATGAEFDSLRRILAQIEGFHATDSAS